MTDLNIPALIEEIRYAESRRLIYPETPELVGNYGLMVLMVRDDEGQEEARVVDLEQYRNAPRRPKGFLRVRTPQNFVDYVLKHGIQGHTLIIADEKSVTAVFNHHAETGTADGAPGWNDWGVILELQYTPSWTGWRGFAGTYQTQENLANWLEEQAMDVINPSGGELLDIIRNLRLVSQSVVQRRINLENGAVTFYFNEDFVPAGGGDDEAGSITVPPGFTIRTQVFRDGPEFEIPVLLRYRVKDGHPEWMFKFTGEASKIFDDAFDNMTSEIAVGTGLPVYRGALR